MPAKMRMRCVHVESLCVGAGLVYFACVYDASLLLPALLRGQKTLLGSENVYIRKSYSSTS